MNELLEEIKLLQKEVKHLATEIEQLKSFVLSDKTNAQWLDEKQAAAMMGYKNGETLRKKVKGGALTIDFTTTNGRSYQYSCKSINNFLESRSIIISLRNR